MLVTLLVQDHILEELLSPFTKIILLQFIILVQLDSLVYGIEFLLLKHIHFKPVITLLP